MTVFEILGIENKELPVSNLLAYYMNPQSGLGYKNEFINDFLVLAGLSVIDASAEVTVEREHHIENHGKNNYIDILIRVGADENNPERIICIENKIDSSEGVDQTKKYYEALQKEYPNCQDRQYIYLTRNNSAVKLSDYHFIHIRYSVLCSLLNKERYRNSPLAKDFLEYYINKDRELFDQIDKKDRVINDGVEKDYLDLIDYIVWKVNNQPDANGNLSYFCSKGKSAKSTNKFFQISKHNWNFELDGYQMNFHLESSISKLYLHMERSPYVPFSKIMDGKGNYIKTRNQVRELININDCNSDTFSKKKIASNAELSIINFVINKKTFKGYVSALFELISYIDDTLKKTGLSDNKTRRK